MVRRMASDPRFRVHIKNNRAGEMVFRVTPERYADACRRHADAAARVDARIDWDLDDFEASIAEAHALITWDLPTPDLGRRAPNLKWIHVIGAGVEHLAPLDWLPPGVTLINNRGIHAEKAGEYGAMALLMLSNGLPRFVSQQRGHVWDAHFATPIAGKTLLVVGAGHMGLAVARRAKGLGLKIEGIRRGGRRARHVDTMHRPDALDGLLPEADFVLVTTPLTAETRNLIDRRRIGLMKPTAGLINMARGPVVDDRALAEALTEGRLAGAILDVFDPEPLPATSTLWDTPNLVITPHVAGDDDVSYIPLTLDLFFENVGRSLAGRPLRNRVRPRLGY